MALKCLFISAADGSTMTPAIRAMERRLQEAFRTEGLKA